MTFTEAALEVLRSAGKPLHYKKITEIAIERNLLSHVGKTPEVTMSARLATMVKMDRGNAPITKVRPGVFTIRDSHKLNQEAASGEEPTNSNGDTTNGNGSEEFNASAPMQTDVPIKPVTLPGADIFPEEDDDDEPILADFDREDNQQEDVKTRRRRRRRRRSKDDDTNEASPKNGGYSSRERDRGPHNYSDSRRRPSNDTHGQYDWHRQPDDGELLGKDLADAVWTVLMRSERHPVTIVKAAELLVRRGRLTGHAAALAPTIAAAIRADVSRSDISGKRPRFRMFNQRVELTDWLLPRDVIRSEETAIRAAERQREQVRRGLIHKLNDLPTASFAEFIATWLNAEGVISLRAVRRPGTSGSQLHFAGTLRRRVEETRLAIVVQRDGKGIDRERVIDVRGALHHYGNATTAWLVTTGRAISGAWEEAAVTGAAPCVLFDGQALAEAMERLGIGIKRHSITITNLDHDLFSALGDGADVKPRIDAEHAHERERSYRSRRNKSRTGAPNTSRDAEPDKPKSTRGSRASTRVNKEEPEEATALLENDTSAEDVVSQFDADTVEYPSFTNINGEILDSEDKEEPAFDLSMNSQSEPEPEENEPSASEEVEASSNDEDDAGSDVEESMQNVEPSEDDASDSDSPDDESVEQVDNGSQEEPKDEPDETGSTPF